MDDEDGVVALFRAEYPRLVRALTVSFGAPVAEDAVSEAFLRADKHWRKVAAYDSPEAWVRRVAINLALNGRRNERRRQRLSPRASTPAELTAELVDLRDAIAALPPKTRLTFCLHYLAGLTVDEAAASLGVAPGTVKSALHDARIRLQAALREDRHA